MTGARSPVPANPCTWPRALSLRSLTSNAATPRSLMRTRCVGTIVGSASGGPDSIELSKIETELEGGAGELSSASLNLQWRTHANR